MEAQLAEYGYLELCDQEITGERCSVLSNKIRLLNIEDKVKHIILVIDSLGGSVDAAEHLSFSIKGSHIPVIGIAKNMCCSAAVNVLLSCHERLAVPGTIFLTHSMQFGDTQTSGTITQKNVDVKFFEMMAERCVKDYSRVLGFDEKFITQKLMPKYGDVLFDENDACEKYNIVNEICDERYVNDLIADNLKSIPVGFANGDNYCKDGDFCNCKDEIR